MWTSWPFEVFPHCKIEILLYSPRQMHRRKERGKTFAFDFRLNEKFSSLLMCDEQISLPHFIGMEYL